MRRAYAFILLLITSGCLQAAETGASDEPLRFETSRRWIKTSIEDCRIRGGEYVGPPDLRPDDIVTCHLPTQTRGVGGVVTGQPKILASVYDYLYRASIEPQGYGLYSYVLLPAKSSRGQRLLDEIFRTTSFVNLSGMTIAQLNLMYLPTRTDKLKALLPLINAGEAPKASKFSQDFYDYAFARTLLAKLCAAIPDGAQSTCAGDPSFGPYIFTFTQPVSAVERVPPPFLIVDLSNVHDRAFGEFVAAYKEQVKQPQFSERERIDTFRLRMLSVVLTSSDWLRPVVGGAPQAATLIE